MARDWRKVALAALTAATLVAVCVPDAYAQPTKQKAKNAKPPEPEAAQSEEGDDAPQPKAAPAKKKKQDPAEAQRAIEAATKLLHAGKAEHAAQALTATLAGGNLPPAIMAKALYVRGMAYRQQSKPAQAISDLTNALWLKGGLAEGERADALKQRAAAYSDAGLSESGEMVAAARERPAKSSSAETSAPAGQAGGNWFANLFNLPANSAPATPAPQTTGTIPKEADGAQAPREARPRATSGWASGTQVQANREVAAAPVVAPPRAKAEAPPPTPAPKPAGRFRVQLAAVRTQQEAVALAAKAKREHAAALAAREPEIDQAVLGNMGSFYRVRVGPFATVQETQAVCAKLKGSGFDCMSVTQ